MDNKRFKILVVDDTLQNIQVVGTILQNQSYQVAFATNGQKALDAITQNYYDLILLDVMMPNLNGYDTCRALKKLPNGEHVPVIFLTAKDDEASIIEGFDSGGIDYVTKPFDQRELLARVGTQLKLKSFEDDLEFKVQKLTTQMAETQREVIFTLGAIGETRSKETGNHVKRVAQYSYILAIKYGLSEKQARLLEEISPMHDIGNVAIPDAILNKAGKLNPDEWEVMKTHTTLGYEMLKHSDRPILKAAATLALSHHERFDGSGYPQGLKGQDIPIYGRITAICDVFDVLGSARCYKTAWTDEDIFSLLQKEKGKQFDPELVDLMFANMNEILNIKETLRDSD